MRQWGNGAMRRPDDSSRTAYQIISPIRPPARVVVIDTRPRPESGRSRGKGHHK